MNEPRRRTNLQRGGLALAVAKLFFLLSGYAISIALTRLVDPATFGLYGVVSMVIAVPNMVLIQTVLFTVSRPMAAEITSGLASYGALRRRGFRLAAALGGAVGLVFWAGAEVIATRFFRDPALTLPLRTVAPIPVIYALYAVNIGTLNATRRFGLQATLDMFMAATKAGLIVGAAVLGWELARILGGFTVAAGLALTLSVVLVAIARPGRAAATGAAAASDASAPAPAPASLWSLAGSLLIFTAAVNLLLALDLLILKRFVASAAEEAALGFYTSANLVARVPQALMNAMSLMIFPLVATFHALGDRTRMRHYVGETLKVTAMLLVGMSAVATASAQEIQRLLFPAAYGAVAGELQLLVWGFSGYSLAITCAWIFNSTARSRVAIALVLGPLAALAIAAFVLVPTQATEGAATAVAIAGAVAAASALAAMRQIFGAALPLAFVARVGLAVAAVLVLGGLWHPAGKVLILGKLAGLTVVLAAVLLLTRAVTIAEIRGLRSARTD